MIEGEEFDFDNLPLTLQEFNCNGNPIYYTYKKTYGIELSTETMKQHNKARHIANLEKECCPMLK